MINTKLELFKQQCKQLRVNTMTQDIESLLQEAETNQITYLDFLQQLFDAEIQRRIIKDKQKRMRLANLPLQHDLNAYDFNCDNTIEKQQLAQLRELKWLEQNYNLILMGPSGTGKTYLAAGLACDAVDLGYRAYFQTMESLVRILTLKDMTSKEATAYKRICNAHLIVIDDIMMFPITK